MVGMLQWQNSSEYGKAYALKLIAYIILGFIFKYPSFLQKFFFSLMNCVNPKNLL